MVPNLSGETVPAAPLIARDAPGGVVGGGVDVAKGSMKATT